MLPHVLHHAVNILEEADMAQLVHLIVADGLHLQLFLDIFQVVQGRGQGRDAGAREADLRGGRELVDQVRIPGPLAFRKDLKDVVLVMVIQMMDGIGIVPVEAEILCRRLQTGHPADSLVRVGVPAGVRVLRHAPDALDGLILGDKLLDQVHIRTVLKHRHRDILDPEILRDGEMAVVSRHHTEEFHLVQLAPGRISHDAVAVGAGNGVVHDVQAGVPVEDQVVIGDLHHVSHQLLGLRNAAEHAVIPAVRAVLAGHIRGAAHHVHHAHGEIQLLGTGISAAHIQLQVLCLHLLVGCLQLAFQRQQLFLCKFCVRFHSPYLLSHLSLFILQTVRFSAVLLQLGKILSFTYVFDNSQFPRVSVDFF